MSTLPASLRGRPARNLLVGAGAQIAGLMLVGTGHPATGGVLVLGGWLVLGACVHALGRG